MVVDVFEVVVDGCRWLFNFFEMVLGGFRLFHVLVTTGLGCSTASRLLF